MRFCLSEARADRGDASYPRGGKALDRREPVPPHAELLHAASRSVGQQLRVYIGWLLHRTLGGVIAGVFYVLPGVVAIMALSWVYAIWGNVGFVEALFFGLKAPVLAIVLQAVIRIGSRALKCGPMIGIAAAAFVAIFVFDLPFPLIVLAAALVGFVGARSGWRALSGGGGHGRLCKIHVAYAASALGEEIPEHARPTRRQAFRLATICLVLWLTPVLALLAFLGFGHVFTGIALFFSALAVVTFGGTYGVLAWVAQEAVGTFGWLGPGEMLDGHSMAETTPGR